MKYIATLVRGKTYTYQGKVYANGVPVEIDSATKNHFEIHAKDEVTVEGKLELRAKFKISEAAAPAAEKDDKPIRTRKRKPAEDFADDENQGAIDEVDA